jgi:hypothetical protein
MDPAGFIIFYEKIPLQEKLCETIHYKISAQHYIVRIYLIQNASL